MTPMLPAIAGALIVAGIIGVTVGIRPAPPRAPAPTKRLPGATRLSSVSRRTRTLLLAGTQDLSTPLEWAKAERAHAPGGRLLVVAGAGHSLQSQDRPEVERHEEPEADDDRRRSEWQRHERVERAGEPTAPGRDGDRGTEAK